MNEERFRDLLYRIIINSDMLEMASLSKDFQTDNIVLIELDDGTKFEITVTQTDRFV